MNTYLLNFTNNTIAALHAFQTVVSFPEGDKYARARAARRTPECRATTIDVPSRSYRRMFVDITTGQPMFLGKDDAEMMCSEQHYGKNGLVVWNGEPESLHNACYSSVRQAIENYRFMKVGLSKDCRMFKIDKDDKVCGDQSMRLLPEDHPQYGWFGDSWFKIYDREVAKLQTILDEIDQRVQDGKPLTLKDVTIVGEVNVGGPVADHLKQINKEVSRRLEAETQVADLQAEIRDRDKRMRELEAKVAVMATKLDGRFKFAKNIKKALNPDGTESDVEELGEPIGEITLEDVTL